jgi:hypothetical protein
LFPWNNTPPLHEETAHDKKKIICGTLGRVKRLIKRLGDRSSNPLTYGYSSSDSFGYDRDYEPRHVVGIA